MSDNYSFFAMVNRMKYIDRWALMPNTQKENIAEHSHSVAVIAHALALIGKREFGKDYDENRVAVLALYHDTTEVITGDMPTPVKYYNDDIKSVLQDLNIEKVDGILLDLGVSSYQLDEKARGFSYIGNSRLDMRMDQEQNLTAEIVVNGNKGVKCKCKHIIL